jgi:hypothetical protein
MRKPAPRSFGTRGSSNNPPKTVAGGHSAPRSAQLGGYLVLKDRTSMVGFLVKSGVALWAAAIVLVVFFG